MLVVAFVSNARVPLCLVRVVRPFALARSRPSVRVCVGVCGGSRSLGAKVDTFARASMPFVHIAWYVATMNMMATTGSNATVGEMPID